MLFRFSPRDARYMRPFPKTGGFGKDEKIECLMLGCVSGARDAPEQSYLMWCQWNTGRKAWLVV